ncbi:SDR family NAD(P)-dependent oxidoreductase [Prescottella agglutinans]|uniref:NAD(P)-dependent dehydrogenase (Short-subunit alcohol dehydrogenase family) n=1 Tax=Prescottella agglutinans TaxID=1644129 RepID=A0ABT6M9I7_9NOCA|nr:SDR family NAD(P)-dependent oxidoreductase [Prescottella agglutinans]MDH6280900.1 NAD(P)-dependent dehydrogenase (short-subunit alcohol dehydrogenase family) [Prescottella agglutinans]
MNGFGPDSTTDDVLSGVDLGGRTALVTGVTSGLGGETARALAAAGAAVVLAARDGDAAAGVADQIRETVPGAELSTVALDLADLSSIRTAVEHIGTRPIDLLINNAGVMYTPFARTGDGFELQFGTNHLGHFLLTTSLAPNLLSAADRSGSASRVVTVSSDAHRAHAVDLADPNFLQRPYDKFVAYGQSKAANVLMTVGLRRRHADNGIHAFAVHPGVCATGLSRHMSREDFAEMKRMSAGKPGLLANLKSIPAAAATSVWAASAPELTSESSAYLSDCRIDRAADHAVDPETAAALWELSGQLVGL